MSRRPLLAETILSLLEGLLDEIGQGQRPSWAYSESIDLIIWNLRTRGRLRPCFNT